MKYKVGDKVRIKPKFHFCSVDGFNNINMKDEFFNEYSRLPYCETAMTIGIVNKDFYILKEDRWAYKWTDEMIECKVEEETKPKFKVGDRVKWYNHTCNITSIDIDENTCIYLIKHDDYREDKTFAKWVPESELTFEDDEETKPIDFTIKATDTKGKVEVVIPESYGYVVENDKLYFVTKKKEYPKTYEECCKVMGINHTNDLDICEHCDYKTEITFYEDSLLEKIETLYRFIICRDTYWKLYGEEMGLGKPWEPDWKNLEQEKHCIWVDVGSIILRDGYRCQHILAFPTEEIRDIFYENFKELIEQCKEFL